MLTGPSTHQSPLQNWPTVFAWSNCQVTPHCVIDDASVGALPPPEPPPEPPLPPPLLVTCTPLLLLTVLALLAAS